MRKIIVVFLFFISVSFAAVIVADQGKVSTLSGGISVSSEGVTQNLNAGEVVETSKGKAPSKPRKLEKNELKDILKDTSTKDLSKKINIVVGIFTKQEALYRYKKLKEYFRKSQIVIKKKGNLFEMKIENVKQSYAQKIFPKIKPYLRKVEDK